MKTPFGLQKRTVFLDGEGSDSYSGLCLWLWMMALDRKRATIRCLRLLCTQRISHNRTARSNCRSQISANTGSPPIVENASVSMCPSVAQNSSKCPPIPLLSHLFLQIWHDRKERPSHSAQKLVSAWPLAKRCRVSRPPFPPSCGTTDGSCSAAPVFAAREMPRTWTTFPASP